MPGFRVGCGYDLHAFTADRPLVLGGVRVDYERGLAGHSDADVLTHAVIDALLGAAGWGDIGEWFPSSDETYRDADSLTLLDTVVQALRAAGWRIANLDATILAQEPHLGRHRAAIRLALAKHLDLDPARVSVKATTPDHLGAIGRAEGIAAQAVSLLEEPTSIEGASRG